MIRLAGLAVFAVVAFLWSFIVAANPRRPRWLAVVAVADVAALALLVPALRPPLLFAIPLGVTAGLAVGLLIDLREAVETMLEDHGGAEG